MTVPACADTHCKHDEHCSTAHYRKAHTASIVPSPKMDTQSLVAAVCSCGGYRSSPGGSHAVSSAHKHHHLAKMEALAKRPVCPDCPEELRALAAERAALLPPR